jgi:hypothetical protein
VSVCLVKYLDFQNSSFALKILFNVNGKAMVRHTPCLVLFGLLELCFSCGIVCAKNQFLNSLSWHVSYKLPDTFGFTWRVYRFVVEMLYNSWLAGVISYNHPTLVFTWFSASSPTPITFMVSWLTRYN